MDTPQEARETLSAITEKIARSKSGALTPDEREEVEEFVLIQGVKLIGSIFIGIWEELHALRERR